MAKGIVESKLYPASQIIASDKWKPSLEKFKATVGCDVTDDNIAVVNSSSVIILAVKPGIIPLVMNEIKGLVTSDKLIISIAAGVTTSTIQSFCPSARVIRVMPNTPCLVLETASAYCLGKNAEKKDGEVVEKLLSSCGVTHQIKESLLDAVTGLSGSGPAYVYIMIEAMADGGVRMGLPRSVALNLAAQTVLGSAKMVLETGEHPGLLKDKVASPGGTTIAGIHALERGGIRATLMNAVEAAASRSSELSKKAAAESKK
eukprot:CAMPEP_0197524586 /NCGR_PEP_ID=MMETSP1318-20131121/9214_1 /TAXON_ID=552666 /ORGANISM="Partenskyella glossopodia, Strain RCC365" /LENGTH=259 /DNA_ID=CAMNT_0043077565 /DNA_START=114 /DNA_END=896 /DNA_ORIENTATION=+